MANFARLWKDKVFWLGTIAMLIWAMLILLSGHQSALAAPEERNALEDYFFQHAPIIGGFCAVFTSLFLGTDYSDGTIRNKISVGHSRQAIYLSNMFVCFVAGIIMNSAWALAMLAIGTPLFGWFVSSMTIISAYLFVIAFIIAALVSIFTLISMLNQNKASVAVIALLAFLMILLLASYCNNRLHEPEMYSAAPLFTTNGVEQLEASLNPDYVSGNIRKIYEFIIDFLPTGQGILMSNMEATHLQIMPIYSLIIVITTTAVGILIFRNKNLK